MYTKSTSVPLTVDWKTNHIWQLGKNLAQFFFLTEQIVNQSSDASDTTIPCLTNRFSSKTISQTMSRNHQIDWTTSDNFTGRNNANATRSNTSLNAQSTSSLDLINNNVSYNTQERDATLKALLPVYRLAPDYETAIRKMNQKQRTNDTHLHTSHKVASDPHLNVYSVSQPDVHRATDATLGHHHRQQHPDVTSYYRNFTPNVNRMDALPHHQLMRMHKRPPAYPTEWLISSTPDLAGASHRALFRPAFVTGSSPDLISQQATIQAVPSNAVRRHHSQTQMPHGAAEQLNANLLLPNAYRVSPQQQYGYIGSSRQLSGSIEPIHENQIYQSQTDVTGTSYQSHQQRLSNPNVVQILQHSSRSLESISQHQTSASSVDPNELSGVSRRHVQFDALNRSQSADLLDSGVVTSSSEDRAKEKKKRRWKFWGNKGKSSLNEKAKSGTLERDKGKSGKKALSTEEEIDSRHRWSTGLPRVPVPTTISKEKLVSFDTWTPPQQNILISFRRFCQGQILGTKLADPQLYVEYERIPKRKANESYDCALNDENRTKNFDPSFLPYDGNRVRLTPSPGNRLGYYNASVISATVGTKQRFYIIAQSPHAVNELSTFLQCVWEADVYLLVQLSDEVNYVPETSNNCAEYGQVI